MDTIKEKSNQKKSSSIKKIILKDVESSVLIQALEEHYNYDNTVIIELSNSSCRLVTSNISKSSLIKSDIEKIFNDEDLSLLNDDIVYISFVNLSKLINILKLSNGRVNLEIEYQKVKDKDTDLEFLLAKSLRMFDNKINFKLITSDVNYLPISFKDYVKIDSIVSKFNDLSKIRLSSEDIKKLKKVISYSTSDDYFVCRFVKEDNKVYFKSYNENDVNGDYMDSFVFSIDVDLSDFDVNYDNQDFLFYKKIFLINDSFDYDLKVSSNAFMYKSEVIKNDSLIKHFNIVSVSKVLN